MAKRFLYLQVKHSAARVAEASFALTPKVSLYADRHLYLEIAGTAKLFGGEMGLLQRADEIFSAFLEPEDRRFVVTDRAEWAQACLQDQDLWIPPDKSEAFFWTLPVQRLSLCGDPQTLEDTSRDREKLAGFMKQVGIKRVGDFAKLPVASVKHRFGELGLVLHDWARGKKDLLPPLYAAQEKIQETIADDIPSLETLLFLLRTVFVRFEAQLKGRAQAVKTLKFEFLLEEAEPLVKYFEISDPCQDATQMVKLLRDFFRDLHWESPLVSLHVQVLDAVPYKTGQLSLFDKLENNFEDLGKFIGRLRGRFGEDQVGVPELLESYLPEKSWRLAWPPPKKKSRSRDFPDRPLFLFPRPAPFPNPERFELKALEDLWTEWWDGSGPRRYFIAAKPPSPALWVYLDVFQKKWFVHGSFD